MITTKSKSFYDHKNITPKKKAKKSKRPLSELDPNIPLHYHNRENKKHIKIEKVKLNIAQKQIQKNSSGSTELKKFLKKKYPDLYELLCKGKLLLDFTEDEMLYKID